VAREAGVSIATISRVINCKSVVSEKTREKVEVVLKKYNYKPNEIARGLVVNSMRTVGVMTIDIRDIYYANVAYTVEQELRNLGYTVILCNTGDDQKEKIRYLKTLEQKKVDGIILVGSVFKDTNLEEIISDVAAKIPVVMINGFVDSLDVYCVICDDSVGVSEAVDYLSQKNKKNPIYLKDSDTFSAVAKLKGFQTGMLKNGLDVSGNTIFNVEKGLDGGYKAIELAFTKGVVFDAVVCGEDITAIGAIKALQKYGVKVPDQVSVIGFNDSILAQCCDPSLTSIDSRMDEMGKRAVEIFSKVINGEQVQNKNIIKPKLFVRDSG